MSSLRGRALRLLARREHSRQELEGKLAAHVQAGEDLPAVLDELEARGWISAQRVAESILHRKAARLGNARLVQEMRTRGLDAQTIRSAVAQLEGNELERARAVWQRRFGTPPDSPRERARQMRFLASRGFAFGVAAQVLGGGGMEDAEENVEEGGAEDGG